MSFFNSRDKIYQIVLTRTPHGVPLVHPNYCWSNSPAQQSNSFDPDPPWGAHRNYCWRESPTQQSNSFDLDPPWGTPNLQRAVNRQPSYRARDCWVGVFCEPCQKSAVRDHWYFFYTFFYALFRSRIDLENKLEFLLDFSKNQNFPKKLP